jgi:hypothetical protein
MMDGVVELFAAIAIATAATATAAASSSVGTSTDSIDLQLCCNANVLKFLVGNFRVQFVCVLHARLILVHVFGEVVYVTATLSFSSS